MTPVYIEGCYGVLHQADGQHGVVICGSLGDESMNIYRSQVFLGEELARAGFPALRISYYGTGDSAGADDEPDRFLAWTNSITAAVRWLRSECGVTSVSLCGVRIGAALAARAASELDDIDALILLAPVTSGRRFLREQILAARTIAEIWQSKSIIDDGQWYEAYGLRLDRATRDALDGLDIAKLRLPVRRVMLLEQSGAAGSTRLVDRLRDQGIEVTRATNDRFEDMLRDSHEAEVPHEAFARVVAWLGETQAAAVPAREFPVPRLQFAAFEETAVRLGPGGSLAGVLAVPERLDSDAPVVLIPSTGANPRFSNSRASVTLARWLAEQGIASLRVDGYGIGDSAPETGNYGVPYSKQGDEDVCSGVDFLVERFSGPVVVLGMCSGAYHAFQAALIDARISGLMLVNLQKLVWHSGESLSVVQRTTFRTTGFYIRSIANPMVWKRLAQGKINIGGIARALAGRALRQLAAAATPAITVVSGETQVGMVRRQLKELTQRPVRILYVLSGNDPGLDEIAEYFGPRGWRLRRAPNVVFRTISGADHTLGSHWARQHLRQIIAGYLRECFGVAIHANATEPRRAGAEARPAPVLSGRMTRPGSVIDSAQTAA
jgi:alpha-beta hydrolase superfamily lysophospholipase